MNELTLFTAPTGHSIRTVMRNGDPWFVANDVCAALEISHPRSTIERIDDDCVDSTDATDSMGRVRPTNIVNEAGLYELILGSRKPEAKAFKRWVTAEVLPSIRRTGSYGLPQTQPTIRELLTKQRELADGWLAEIDAREASDQRAALAEAEAAIMRPKVSAYDAFVASAGTFGLAAVAQALRGGRQRLINRLRELGILLGVHPSGVRPYQLYLERGWFEVAMEQTPKGPKLVTRATAKGVMRIYESLDAHGAGWPDFPSTPEAVMGGLYEANELEGIPPLPAVMGGMPVVDIAPAWPGLCSPSE